ncbi:MAG TPA: hypothetical protein DCE42_14950 [Myxococcales bacterium]|nr:hypothetical protein [Myxococcales bacterium]
MTPTSYEVGRWSYLTHKGFCPSPTPKSPYDTLRCGQYIERSQYGRKDCGTDGLCPNDNQKTRVPCDANTKCPNDQMTCNVEQKTCYLKYTKPDDDGSEKDGMPDYFLDCGTDRICPCIAPDKQPSYYGKDKKCLTGHTKNPEYTGPDADGTEGNGKFEVRWMAGFDTNHPIMGAHDPIWARALVLRTGDTTVAIVSVDLVGYFRNKIDEVRKMVNEKLPGNEIDHILISSTHAHEGPDSVGQWGRAQAGVPIETGVHPEFSTNLIKHMAQAVIDAHKSLKKATMKVGKTKTGREGYLRDSRDPKVFDDELHVLQVLGADDGKVISTMVNWGNHPEVLSDINNFITSDFSHYIREGIEKGVPKGKDTPEYKGFGGVGIYLQGAVGGLMTPLRIEVPDLNGVKQSKSDWEKSKALGYNLAIKAFEALKSGEEIKDAEIAFWVQRIKVKMENKQFHTAFSVGLFDREPTGYDPLLPISQDNMPSLITEVSVIRVGPVTFFTAPGELDPEILVGGYDGKHSYGIELIDPNNPNPPDLTKAPKGPYLKERMPGKYKFFVGLGNDFLGYIIGSWNYQLDKTNPYFDQAPGNHYEETNGIGPAMTPALLETYDKLIPMLATPGPPAATK